VAIDSVLSCLILICTILWNEDVVLVLEFVEVNIDSWHCFSHLHYIEVSLIGEGVTY